MALVVIIPARLASSRLPQKALLDLDGLPLVVQVAKRVINGVRDGVRVLVATDHDSIVKACEKHGIATVMTDEHHQSGTDRLAQAAHLLNLMPDDVVLNVQGDEPLIDMDLVRETVQLLEDNSSAHMATAAHPIYSHEELTNPNVVKVVLGAERQALYFSRAPIPWNRDEFANGIVAISTNTPVLRHVGLYVYRVAFLLNFPSLDVTPLERCESLEQLRVLENGYTILVHISEKPLASGVDTLEDLERIRKIFAKKTGTV